MCIPSYLNILLGNPYFKLDQDYNPAIVAKVIKGKTEQENTSKDTLITSIFLKKATENTNENPFLTKDNALKTGYRLVIPAVVFLYLIRNTKEDSYPEIETAFQGLEIQNQNGEKIKIFQEIHNYSTSDTPLSPRNLFWEFLGVKNTSKDMDLKTILIKNKGEM